MIVANYIRLSSQRIYKKLCYSATQSLSQNFTNCCITVYKKSRTNGRMELEGCNQPTCNKLCASSHDALDRRSLQAWPSTSFDDSAIDLPLRNVLRLEFGAKFQREVPLFLEITEFPENRIVQRKPPCQKTSYVRLVVSIQYRHVTDRQTNTRRHDSIYRASIASCGTNYQYFRRLCAEAH